MADTITIKTTGGDVYINLDPACSVAEQADRIRTYMDSPDSSGWLRLPIRGGTALVRTSTITGIIATRAGKAASFKG